MHEVKQPNCEKSNAKKQGVTVFILVVGVPSETEYWEGYHDAEKFSYIVENKVGTNRHNRVETWFE